MSTPEHRYYEVGGDYYCTWGEDVVQFWNGHRWVRSLERDKQAFLDDARADGDEIREVVDMKVVPGVHS